MTSTALATFYHFTMQPQWLHCDYLLSILYCYQWASLQEMKPLETIWERMEYPRLYENHRNYHIGHPWTQDLRISSSPLFFLMAYFFFPLFWDDHVSSTAALPARLDLFYFDSRIIRRQIMIHIHGKIEKSVNVLPIGFHVQSYVLFQCQACQRIRYNQCIIIILTLPPT